MTTLSLSLLGPFAATFNGRALTHFRSNRAQALLIYLAAERAYPHPREALMELLWPGLPQKSAQVNLRQTLYQLRQLTNNEETAATVETTVPLLLTDRHTAQLHPDVALELDVDHFSHLLQGNPGQEQLEDAATLYRGDFLCDFYLPDSAPFEEWAAARRADLRQQALDALDNLTALLMQQAAYEEARAYALRQLEIDNLHEHGHRQLMEILARLGQRSQALAQYEALRQLLQTELGAEPSPKTQALYEQIQRAEVGTAVHLTRRVRGYHLHEEIGAGAFGVVYRAVQPVVGREVAIKIIAPDYANQPDFIRRFEAEARIIARLEHPHIVPLYDYWREPDGAFLVMRWLRGGNLGTRLQKGPCDLETAVRILDQLSAALSIAHRRGIVHRDIKPANILLDEEGNAYLSDFGIAKELAASAHLTQEGAIIGSPAYLAPEQALGQSVTPQADIYSLGVVLYEMLTGEHPFRNTPLSDLLSKHLREPLPSTHDRNPDLPPFVDSIIQQATAKSPDGRFPDVRAMALALKEQVHGKIVPATLDVSAADLVNPYKGLRPFEEADAADFFGRSHLVEQLLSRMAQDSEAANFLAVVGPSGSGKSSVVKAGLLPALRQGALPGAAPLPGSDQWFVVSMTPGARPFDELEIGLLRIAARQPAGLGEQLRRDEYGLLRAARLALPDDQSTLLLLIDQFEELFTAVPDPAVRDQFLSSLATAVSDPHSPLRILITLRADFYDRPLLHPAFGELMRQHTEVVLPLSAAELAEAIREPAQGAGAELETGLVTVIVADVAEQPGVLPMLQYALMELFARRDGRLLSKAAYQTIGGVTGALARRAEGIYDGLDTDAQEAARQLFLRLVTLGEGVEDTKRRVLRSELEALSVNREPIADYGSARLLTFDNDPETREPTVEVAHEALLREWPRLRVWLDESRADVRTQRLLNHAAVEWQAAGQDASFLLRGSRLDQFAEWGEATDLALTGDEQAFLAASVAARTVRRQEEADRLAHEAALEKRSRRFLRALAAVMGVAFIVALILSFYAFRQRQDALVAYSQSLAAHAQHALESGDTAAALTLAFAANDMDQPPELAQRMLRQAAYAPGPRQQFLVADLFPDVTGRIYSLAMSPIENVALIGFEDGSLILWDVSTQTELRRFIGHTGIVRAVTFSPDGQTALSGGSDRLVILWDVETGQEIRRFEGHDGWVRTVDFSPDGKTAVSGGFVGDTVSSVSEPGQLITWDLTSGQEIRRFAGHPSGVVAAAFTADGSGILASSGFFVNVANEYSLILWDVETGEKIRDFAITGNSDNFSLAVSPDGQTALSGTSDNDLILWEVSTGKPLRTLEGHTGQMVTSAAFTPDGRYALTGDANGLIILWDMASHQPVMQTNVQVPNVGGWHADDAPVLNLAISSDGRTALSSAGDGTLVLWELINAAEIRRFAGHKTEGLTSVAFTPDGKRVLTAEWGDAFGYSFGSSNNMRLWDVATGEELQVFEGHTAGISMIAVSADGRKALTGSEDGTIRLWDLETGVEIRSIFAHTEGVFSVALSPDGRTALSGSMANNFTDSGITLWDLESGQMIHRLTNQDHFTSLIFAPDGQTAYSDGSGFGLNLYDLTTGAQLPPFAENARCCTGFALHPNGRSIFLANNNNGPVIEWDLEANREIRTFGQFPGARTRVEVSQDGRLLLVSAMGDFTLWDLKTGQEIRSFSSDGFCCIDIDMSPDGSMAITPGGGGTAILWDLTLPAAIGEVRDWISDNRYVRPLSCEERELYRIEPLCES